jgi:hypothetical protein
MRRSLLAIAGCVVLTVAACSKGTHHAAPPTTTTRPATTVGSGPDPDVIPQVITAAYVDAVFTILNHINGNVSRQLVHDHSLSSASFADLRAIFADPLFGTEVTLAKQSADGNMTNVRNPPGDVITRVNRLFVASDRCIFVETSSDFRHVLLHPGPPAASEYYRLTPKKLSTDPSKINPTPWAFSFNATYKSATNVPNQCVA